MWDIHRDRARYDDHLTLPIADAMGPLPLPRCAAERAKAADTRNV